MTTQKKGARGYDPESQEAWRDELNVPVRIPRSGYENVQEMLINLQMPMVFLREHSKTTDIVIRLNCSSKQLSPVLKKMYFGRGIEFSTVFDHVLSKTVGKGRSRLGSELSRLGHSAYREAWVNLFEILYLNTSHPAVNPPSWLAEFKNSLRRKSGRRKQEDAGSFHERFKFFLEHCEKLQASIAIIIRRAQSEDSMTDAIGRRVKESLLKEIFKIPGGVSILGGEAFLEIPYVTQEKIPVIENLESWTPRQLAIALLALESGLTYETVEKRMAEQGRPKSNKPR